MPKTRPSVLGHIHYFHKQAAGHRLWVCSGRNYCRKHSESQPNLRASYYTMDNLQIKGTLFTCWLFFQLSSQYICCAIAVLGSWEKNFLYKQAGLFSLQESFQKGCFVSFGWCTALSANPRILQNDFDSKGYRERDVWNPILQNTPFVTELRVFWLREVLQNRKTLSLLHQDTFVFKRGQPPSPSHRDRG